MNYYSNFITKANNKNVTEAYYCILYKTRYDYNLTIMKSPKPATDTIYPHIKY